LSAPRRRPSAASAEPVAAARPRGPWRGALLAGLALGLAVALAVDRGTGERWRAEVVVGLEEGRAGARDLAVEARRVATTPFREAVRARLSAPVRRALAEPTPLAELRTTAAGWLRTATEQIAGPSLARSLSTRLGSDPPAPATLPALRLDAELEGDGRTLAVGAKAPTAEAATAVAAAAGEALIAARTARRRESIERRLTATETALADTRARIADARTRLARAEPAALAAARDALAEIDARLDDAAARLALSRADRRELETAAEPPRDLDTLVANARGDDLADAVRGRERAAGRLAELDETYGERHPVLIAAREELAAREAAVAEAVAAQVAAARRAEERRAETVAALREARAARAEALAEREAARARAESIEAEIARHRERLDALVATRAELIGAEAAAAPDARVLLVGDAAPVGGPADTAVLYGGGAAGGLLLGALAGFVRRARPPARLASDDDLARTTALPVVTRTAVPGTGAGLAPDDGLRRLALRLESDARPARTVALLSAGGGPVGGRVAVALARALAAERLAVAVVVLDADRALMPRPRRRRDGADLDAVLAGEARWSDAVAPLGDHGPWLIAPSPGARRDGARPALDGLLGQLGRRFDRVLVAGADLERAETLRAARACQGVLVVVERGRTRGADLGRGLTELDAVGAAAGGLVLVG
jgi:uncharacterized protein involved in exopolysaccharide biosynthesis